MDTVEHSLMRMFRDGAGGVLEGVAHGVAHHGGLVAVGALAAVVARLDVLLGIVPRAAGVGHKDRHGKARC